MTLPIPISSSEEVLLFFLHQHPLSIPKAVTNRMGNIQKVTTLSHESTTPGVINFRTTTIQMYANMLKHTQVIYTGILLIFRISPSGIQMIHIPVITSRLKAADPTIVPGPSSPASSLFPTSSMTDIRISGALVPKAIRLKFATVSFQTLTSKTLSSFFSIFGMRIIFVLLVIFSIPHMNESATMDVPRKHQSIPRR